MSAYECFVNKINEMQVILIVMDLTVQIIQSIFYLRILSFSLCFHIFFALLEIKNTRLHVY